MVLALAYYYVALPPAAAGFATLVAL